MFDPQVLTNWKRHAAAIEDFDQWKEIDTERKSELIIEDKNYRIIGLSFYQEKNQNQFRETLDEILKL